MTEITRTRTIPAPRSRVWDVLADFGDISRWADNVDHSCILQHGDGEPTGTTRRIQSGRMTVVERIVEHDAPAALAYDIEGLPTRVRSARNRWTLTEVDDASTQVTLTTTVDVGSRPPQRLAARVVARVLARQSETMLDGLAAEVENPDG